MFKTTKKALKPSVSRLYPWLGYATLIPKSPITQINAL
jgi:hypothetical protein